MLVVHFLKHVIENNSIYQEQKQSFNIAKHPRYRGKIDFGNMIYQATFSVCIYFFIRHTCIEYPLFTQLYVRTCGFVSGEAMY